MAILGLLQAGAGAYSGITGFLNQRRAEKQLSRPLPAEQRVAEIAAILRDPDTSPLFKAQLAAEFESLMQPVQQNITMQRLADRRAMLRGQRPGFFNPERADENIDYLTSRGSQNIMSQARANVLRRLMDSAAEYRGVGEGERSRLQGYATSQSNRTQMGLDLFKKAAGELGSQYGYTGGYDPSTGVTWNTGRQDESQDGMQSLFDRLTNKTNMTKVY